MSKLFSGKLFKKKIRTAKPRKESRVFAVLQRFGGSLLVAVALLPGAGILLGIGTAFTNEGFINSNGLSAVLGEGTILYQFFSALKTIGQIVFDILPLLFAIGLAVGMSDQKKHISALAATFGYLVFIGIISAILYVQNINPKTTTMDYLTNFSGLSKGDAASITGKYVSLLGIFTLNMGIFGGIVVGLIVAKINNSLYAIESPTIGKTLTFKDKAFLKTMRYVNANSLVVIISIVLLIALGAVFYVVWPLIQSLIAYIGIGVSEAGIAGTFFYGFIERSLVPFGLHHVFYLPFWQSEVGGTAVVGGQVVVGAQNIFFNEMFVQDLSHFNVAEGTRFMAGKFPFMMFGLPAAGLAMIMALPKQNRKAFSAIYISAMVTSFLTGITEPLEYTFLFVAPALYYGFHAVMAGLSFLLMHALNVGVGMTFSGGFIDFTLFGLLQGVSKTTWYWIPIVGIAMMPVYFFVFKLYIAKYKPAIPGMQVERAKLSIATALKAPPNIYGLNKIKGSGNG